MKRITIVSIAVAALLLTAFVVVKAETRVAQAWCGGRWHHAGPTGFLARELKLSDAQRAQIRALWQAERPTVSVQVHELLAENKQMNALAASANPDPNEVKKIAERQAATVAALLVEKARLQSEIYSSVLNPEQRAQAETLRTKWESRLDRFADRIDAQPDGK